MTLLTVFVLIGVLVTLVCFGVWGAWLLASYLWRRAGADRPWRRLAIIVGCLALLASPYIAWEVYIYRFTLARLPEQLEVASIEFQNEEHWGIGLPSDNETGFIAYRLTPESSNWIRRQGTALADNLSGGRTEWSETPIVCSDQSCRWQNDMVRPTDRPSLQGYLGRYGFGIQVDPRWVDKVNQAIRAPGSVYRYKRGGGVTIVVPAQGMAYHAYAG